MQEVIEVEGVRYRYEPISHGGYRVEFYDGEWVTLGVFASLQEAGIEPQETLREGDDDPRGAEDRAPADGGGADPACDEEPQTGPAPGGSLYTARSAATALGLAERTVRQHASRHHLGELTPVGWVLTESDLTFIREQVIGRRGHDSYLRSPSRTRSRRSKEPIQESAPPASPSA